LAVTPLLSLRLSSLSKTERLAHVIDSLVRVSRRVEWITDLLALESDYAVTVACRK
jgi:hypothetical protein